MVRWLMCACVVGAVGGCEQGWDGQVEPMGPSGLQPEEVWQDVIVQVAEPAVDVLWVIDDSCSMAENQVLLRKSFPAFMAFFEGSGVDYHIGVTTTSLGGFGEDGRLVEDSTTSQRWMDASTVDPVEQFQRMADVGVEGVGRMGLGATYKCIEKRDDVENAGFYREDASLTTITVSDKADYTPSTVISLDGFDAWFLGLKQHAEQRAFHTIVTDSAGVYPDVTARLGGIHHDVQAADEWPAVAGLLGAEAAGYNNEFFLSRLPQPDSIGVAVITADGPLSPTPDWVYDKARNGIRFVDFRPSALSTIQIDYTLQSTTGAGR